MSQKLSTSARNSESLHVRVTRNQQRREKLTVRLTSVVPWEVVGDQVVKRVLSDGPWARLSRVVSSLALLVRSLVG